MQRVVHFEIYTDDPEAVRPFYQDVFGWTFKKFEGSPVDKLAGDDGRGHGCGNQWRAPAATRGQQPSTMNTVAVPSLDETTKKIEEGGGKICVPKMAIPKMGWLAYAEDPQGNVFGLMEPDTNAK